MALRSDAVALPLASGSVDCVVTSPPYWGLRSYDGVRPTMFGGDAAHEHVWKGIDRDGPGDRYADGSKRRWQHTSNGRGEEQFSSRADFGDNWVETPPAGDECVDCGAWRGCLGLEPTPALYVTHMREIFREVHRVLRSDGTLWLNLGDCYCAAPPGNARPDHKGPKLEGTRGQQGYTRQTSPLGKRPGRKPPNRKGPRPDRVVSIEHRHRGGDDLKPKDLVGIPWMVAFALRADGWWLRSDTIWHKTNPMPESVKDRPIRSHEYLFMLSKSEIYFCDEEAMKEPSVSDRASGNGFRRDVGRPDGKDLRNSEEVWSYKDTRHVRSVWTIPTKPYAGAHFATFPEELVERPIRASSRPGGVVLDPFAGTGTVGRVAIRFGRRAVLCDLSQQYLRDLLPARATNVQLDLDAGRIA
ncbi:MAG: DNA-methyltransferase [Vicinamibacteria bacterium]